MCLTYSGAHTNTYLAPNNTMDYYLYVIIIRLLLALLFYCSLQNTQSCMQIKAMTSMKIETVAFSFLIIHSRRRRRRRRPRQPTKHRHLIKYSFKNRNVEIIKSRMRFFFSCLLSRKTSSH